MTTDPFGGSPTDDRFEFDFTPIREAEGPKFTPGIYPAECTNIQRSIAQKSGNPMWVWEFTCTHGPLAGESLMLYTSLSEKALWKLEETLAALGVSNGADTGTFRRSDILHKPCSMVVEIQVGTDGKERAAIRKIEPPIRNMSEMSSVRRVPA